MHYLILIACLWALPTLSQTTAARWYKGNTHTHSYWSDGDDFPEMIMDWYKSHGYDFVALSDHNILAEGEKWKLIPAQPFRQQRFKEYLAKYGSDWVKQKTDSAGRLLVRLKTLQEYKPLFEEKGKFLIVPAEEITDSYDKKPIHINAFNIKELIKPLGGNSVAAVMQNNLDQVYAQRKRTGQPMFPHINHPNFGWAVKVEDMMQLRGERFFEVYNGHPHVHNYGDSATIGMEELWDRLLIHYLKEGRELLYGLATDDAHNYLEYGKSFSNPGRGWIMVRATELSAAAIIEAMEKGDFYSTTGVILHNIEFNDRILNVQVEATPGVTYTIQFIGANTDSSATEGKILKEIKGTQATYAMTEKDLYVRAKIISSKPKENPYHEGDLETAWTQPVK